MGGCPHSTGSHLANRHRLLHSTAGLILAHLLGASPPAAANVGLVAAVVLPMIYAWSAGRAAHLRGRQLLIITAIAAALGLLMIILKDVVLIHLH